MTPRPSTRSWPVALLAVPVWATCATPQPPPTETTTQPAPVPVAASQVATSGSLEDSVKDRPNYPATRRVELRETIFGQEVEDPYRWLEDAANPEVTRWMDEQDHLARAELAKAPSREALLARLRELLYVDSIGVPQTFGGRVFYSRRHAEKEKAVIYWRESAYAAQKVLLDPNKWSEDGSQSLGGYSVSWDGKTVAYTVKRNNSDEATLAVIDVATGKKSEIDTIEGAKYASASWTPSGDGFYYTYLPRDPNVTPADRPGTAEVRFHKLGTNPKTDLLIKEKTADPRTFVGAELSRDGHWLVYHVTRGTRSNELWVRDMRRAKRGGASGRDDWKPLFVGREAVATVWAWKDDFFIKTDDGAPHGRMFRVDARKPDRANWKEIVPERPDAVLTSFSIVGGHLSLHYLKDVTSQLEVRDLDGRLVRQVPLPALGIASALVGREDEDRAYFTFNSLIHPTEIYETSVRTGQTTLWFKLKVPVEPERFEMQQVVYRGKDGTPVPMFVVGKRDLPHDGTAPAILYGYGGFRVSMLPEFRASIYPWIERGGLFVMANLRGGLEYGESWHRQGMRHAKPTVFDDFIAAAEHLVREGYTSADRLVIKGGSNGGLLVGAAMIKRPELFRAVLCGVPLLDMVRYHLFGSGKTWIEEYGSADDPEDFRVLHAYSPYHHIEPGMKYPATLVLSADSDDRVDPMHARKFAARLQDASSGGPVLLRIERRAGHGGADMIKQAVEQAADEYAFAWAQVARP